MKAKSFPLAFLLAQFRLVAGSPGQSLSVTMRTSKFLYDWFFMAGRSSGQRSDLVLQGMMMLTIVV